MIRRYCDGCGKEMTITYRHASDDWCQYCVIDDRPLREISADESLAAILDRAVMLLKEMKEYALIGRDDVAYTNRVREFLNQIDPRADHDLGPDGRRLKAGK